MLCHTAWVNAETPAQSTPPARPQAPSGATTPSQDALGDQAFVIDAATAGMAEVEHGKLASDKAANAKVKAFGKQMVMDHTKAGDELKSLARSKQMSLPTSIGPTHQAAHDKLAGLSGAAFDQAYIANMVTDHQKAVADFTAEAGNGTDAQVKAFAVKTLPTLQGHLKMVQDLQKEIGKPSGSAK
jgi:putative membrane protein